MEDPQKPLPNITPLVKWLSILSIIGLIVSFNSKGCSSATEELDFAALYQKIQKQEVVEVTIQGNVVSGKYKKTKDSLAAFETQIVEGSADKIAEKLAEQGVRVQVKAQDYSWLNLIASWLPLIIFLAS